MQFIIKHDSKAKFKFAPLQSTQGQDLISGSQVNSQDTVIFLHGDQYLTKSKAIIYILKELGGLWQVFYILILIPEPLRDWFYDFMAKKRYKLFGKRDTCMQPNVMQQKRFLSS